MSCFIFFSFGSRSKKEMNYKNQEVFKIVVKIIEEADAVSNG